LRSITRNLWSPREGGDAIEEHTAVKAGTKGGRQRRKTPSEKLEKGKEPANKDADEEPFFDDTKFTVDLLSSAFRKLEDVGATFDIKVHHYVYKDPSMKGIAFRIHGLAE
jgi:hypothetical protein